MTTGLLLQNSKKRGRPKKGHTQADTAKEFGISQQSVSNMLRIAKLVEVYPALVKYDGLTILLVDRFIKNPEENLKAFVKDPQAKEVLDIIATAIGVNKESAR